MAFARAAVAACLAACALWVAAAHAEDPPREAAPAPQAPAAPAAEPGPSAPAAALAEPDSSSAPADTSTIAFTFAWAPGTVIHQDGEWIRVRVTEGKADTTALSASWITTVKTHPEGLLLEDSDLEFVDSYITGERAQAFLGDVMQRASAMMPAMVIAPDGKLLRIESTPSIKARIDSLLAPLFSDRGVLPEEMRMLVDSISSHDALAARATQMWNTIIGFWLGGELVPGRTYRVEGRQPVAFLPGRTIAMTTDFGITGRVWCTEKPEDGECVELVLRSYPAAGAVEALTQEIVDGLVPNLPFEFEVRDLTIENEVSILMNPASMLPYSSFVHRSMAITVRAGEAGAQEIRQLDERNTTYTY